MINDFRYAKVRALLAVLCTERQPQPRSRLAGMLWADQPEARARASLSQALTTLRRAIGDRTRDRPVIGSDSMQVWIDAADAVDIDVEVVIRLLDACDAHAHQRLRSCHDCGERLKRALVRYQGDSSLTSRSTTATSSTGGRAHTATSCASAPPPR